MDSWVWQVSLCFEKHSDLGKVHDVTVTLHLVPGHLLRQEMEELFYLVQLRSEGYDVMDPRQIDVHVPLGQVPTIMRALGYYPTQRQVCSAGGRDALISSK